MSKKPVSNKRALRQQEERAALNKIFTTFLVGLAAECYLFIVYNFYVRSTVESMLTCYDVLKVLGWVGLAAFIGGAVFALVKKGSEKLRKIGAFAAAGGAFLAVSSWIMVNFVEAGVVTLCVLVPVATILGLIFFLYQRDCFLNTLILSGALFTIWVCSKGLDGTWKLYITAAVIAAVVLLAALCVVVFLMKKNGGKLGKLQVFSAECDYRMIYAVAAVAAALILAALFAPGVTFYLICAAVIALFGELVYYTVKMM